MIAAASFVSAVVSGAVASILVSTTMGRVLRRARRRTVPVDPEGSR